MSQQDKPKMAALAGLSRIRPAAPPAENSSEGGGLPAQAREVALAHGFVERDLPPTASAGPVPQRNRAKPPADTMRLFTMRVATRDANDFIEWCERNRLSYREAFAMMVRQVAKD